VEYEVGQILEFTHIGYLFVVYQFLNAFVYSPLPGAYSIVSKFNDLFSIGVFDQIEEDDSLACGQVHGLHFNWWKHTLYHQGANLKRIGVLTPTEPIHNQQRR